MILEISIGAIALIFLGGAIFILRKKQKIAQRRSRYHRAPFPAKWRRILRREVPFYQRLPVSLRKKLEKQIKVFLAEKTFTACGGLQKVSDEMALAIAGHACVLLLGKNDTACFPTVQSVLVYPDAFKSKVREFDDALGVEIERVDELDGEANPAGSVVLSWRQVLNTIAFSGNGQNIILHEFSHHIRPGGAALISALEAGLRRLRENGTAGVIDSYGAENPEEFWAVSVEAFFENAKNFRAEHGELFSALCNFFNLNPAEW